MSKKFEKKNVIAGALVMWEWSGRKKELKRE